MNNTNITVPVKTIRASAKNTAALTRYLELQELISELTKERETIRDGILVHYPSGETLVGAFKVLISPTTRTTLDRAALVADLGEARVARYEKVSQSEQVRVSIVKPSKLV